MRSRNSWLRAWRSLGRSRRLRPDLARRRPARLAEAPAKCSCSFAVEAQAGDQLAGDGAQGERDLGRLGDGRAAAKDVILPLLDGAQNFKPAAAEEVEIESQLTVDHADQRNAFFEKRAGIGDLVRKQGAKLR